jgi:hypothetical protein
VRISVPRSVMHHLHAGFAEKRRARKDLRLTDCRAGLWINFNEALLKHEIKRIVNRLDEPPPRAPLPRVPRVKMTMITLAYL